jgi:hypothetical protein
VRPAQTLRLVAGNRTYPSFATRSKAKLSNSRQATDSYITNEYMYRKSEILGARHKKILRKSSGILKT